MNRGLPLLLALLSALIGGCSTSGGGGGGRSDLPEGFQPSHLPTATDVTESSLLEQFAAAGATAYELGPGDKVTIDIWGRPEISGTQTIGPDGRLSIPMAGSLDCSHLTREQTEQAIETALLKYFKAVAVTVRVDTYASNSISVLGNVRAPGNFPFTTPPTLLSALSLAGGLQETKNGVSSPRCSVIRGSKEIVWIDLAELLWHGSVGLNIPLRRNDIVYVPDGTGVTVYVLGEVRQAGVFHLTPGMSYLDLIALAGGLDEDADADATRVLRRTDDTRADVDFNEMMTGDLTQNAALQEGDIVYVPTRWLEKWNYVWRKLNPFAGIFSIQTP